MKTFVDHYTRISSVLIRCQGNDQRQRVSNKVVHVSVQLFSNEVYALKMCEENQLLTRMIISLYNMLASHLVQSSLKSKFQLFTIFLAFSLHAKDMVIAIGHRFRGLRFSLLS